MSAATGGDEFDGVTAERCRSDGQRAAEVMIDWIASDESAEGADEVFIQRIHDQGSRHNGARAACIGGFYLHIEDTRHGRDAADHPGGGDERQPFRQTGDREGLGRIKCCHGMSERRADGGLWKSDRLDDRCHQSGRDGQRQFSDDGVAVVIRSGD